MLPHVPGFQMPMLQRVLLHVPCMVFGAFPAQVKASASPLLLLLLLQLLPYLTNTC
jgi:hypothetical protein